MRREVAVQAVKATKQLFRKRVPPKAWAPSVWLATLPVSKNECMRTAQHVYQHTFGDSPPEKSPFDAMTWNMLFNHMSCRKAKHGAIVSDNPNMPTDVLQWLQQWCQ